ncbi:EvpB family type VI secretion protein [Terasakiispira papahanaumokuakeensis]|uniref:EvpB family type VI secretion protein n=1 Tax=Terasakiispira papahanaumokuakeensis TaxID=197479 RepID=A0A1E2V8E0_9GAMM|nr:type VI secretion system contractile sheath large subunit [Terasakiispira papahanaumokuakeensis]ODC03122.1 EvpB family type VI secretion protein [Terasakiispira papahanaumokuakeensis]
MAGSQPDTQTLDAQQQEETPEVFAPESSLLDSIISESRVARSDSERSRTRDLIDELVNQVLEGELTPSKDLIAVLDSRIAEIDSLLSDQLNEIMHANEFQQLEASWRGLKYLTDQSETSTNMKIHVFNASKKDLLKDLKSASEFDQSALFKKVYEEEYGTFGGAPYGMLIGDYEFGRHPQDVYLLEEISHVAAAAHAPFISSASPELFGWDSFTDMSGPRDLAKIFDTVEYAKWKSFRNSEDSRYVGLTLPHVLGRLPYGEETNPVEAFNFTESVDGREHNKYLWMNAAYAMGARVTDAFSRYGWCVAIRGVEGGGLVEDLPTHTFKTDDGEVALKCPTELAITDRREKELSDLGFIPLVHCKGTDYAAFFGVQSAQKAKQYNTDIANANARLSSQLQYIFATSRIAHFMKAIMRDKVGSFASRQNVESFLNEWLAQYVLLDDNAGQEAKAKYPLREARVEVAEIPGKPGAYKAVTFLRPHYQLDELTASLRLVSELPQSARGN